METFAANKEALMDTTDPALPLTEFLASMLACGPDVFTRTADFPPNSANPRMHKVFPTSTAFKMKHKKKRKKKNKLTTMLSVCRRECQPENSFTRLDKFCKRSTALFKEAYELSSLFNAEVAAIVVSPSGKVSEFASSSMSHILKRYQSFQPQMPSNNVLLDGVKRWKHEKLNDKLKDLEELERFLNLSSTINVIQSFESMVAQTLDEIRKRKMELLEVETQKIVQQGEILVKESTMVKEKLIQIISTKECTSNAMSGSEEFCYQHGLDMLQCVEEENSNA